MAWPIFAFMFSKCDAKFSSERDNPRVTRLSTSPGTPSSVLVPCRPTFASDMSSSMPATASLCPVDAADVVGVPVDFVQDESPAPQHSWKQFWLCHPGLHPTDPLSCLLANFVYFVVLSVAVFDR